MCETKQQVCYSKKTTNAAGENFSFINNFTYIYILTFRKTTTVQSWLLNASTINGQSHSTFTMSNKQSRRQNNMREILPGQSMQLSGYKVSFLLPSKNSILESCSFF
jgi:hypothetical protein